MKLFNAIQLKALDKQSIQVEKIEFQDLNQRELIAIDNLVGILTS